MSNTYFRFKQFNVHQDQCAMKVSTDACIQGAWTPIKDDVKKVLDIGAGTGLLSLMLAQRKPGVIIDAVEVDSAAAHQARQNFKDSPWTEQLNVFCADINSWEHDTQYDMIICNPPFFQKSLLGPDKQRNTVRHTLTLNYEQLFRALDKYLSQDGYASVLLPVAEHMVWEQMLVSNGWSISEKLIVRPGKGFSPNRVVSLCSKKASKLKEYELCIYNEDKSYTEAFIELLKPYYLNL